MKQPRESDIVKQCLQWLSLRHPRAVVWRQNQGAFAGEHNGKKRFVRMTSIIGISDIVGVLPGGKFLAVEVKMPGKAARPEQALFLAAVLACGGVAGVVTSIEELEALLRGVE